MNSDFWLYDKLACNLLAGSGYTRTLGSGPEAGFVPGYPAFLAGIYILFGHSLTWVRFAQILASSATVVVIFFLGKYVFRPLVGLVAACVCALYPIYVVLPLRGYSEVLYMLPFLLFLLAFLRGLDTWSVGMAVISGVLIGIANLIRPTGIALPAVLALGLLMGHKEHLRRRLIYLGVFLCAATVAISPWIVRNMVVFHGFVPLGGGRGQNFYRGTFADQANYDADKRLALLDVHVAELHLGNLPLQEWDSVYYPAGVRRITEHPWGYLRLLPRKFLAYWYLTDSTWMWPYVVICQSLIVWPGLVSLAAIFFSRRTRRIAFPLVVVVLYFIVLHVLMYPLARYSLPIVPILIMSSGAAISQLLAVRPRRQGNTPSEEAGRNECMCQPSCHQDRTELGHTSCRHGSVNNPPTEAICDGVSLRYTENQCVPNLDG